ncbi:MULTISPECIES: RHS repeat-associated core domain-containing protein [unclassified Curtobacterium]|uniref:RHS repeat-associated core domain-containing protein n=1 Tax=unclassified Curtobacterium TaxID=257496 RepID=UPI0038302369
MITSRTVAGTGTASVISDPTTGQPLDLQTTDGTTSIWIIDGTGNPAAAIADTGKTAYTVSYDSYGAETVGIGGDSAQWQQNPYGFKSGLRSSSTDNGLTKFGYRWQSSVTGAWIERDTLDAPLSPTNANRYAFAGTDPVNSSDPSGQLAFEDVGKSAGYAGYAGDIAEIGIAVGQGNSKKAATKFVGAVVGGIAGATCEGIVAGATGGVGVVGTVGCIAVAGVVSDATTGEL